MLLYLRMILIFCSFCNVKYFTITVLQDKEREAK